MIKDAMEKNEKATPNRADLEVLKKHFGMCFNSDGSLDLEKLKARLGDQAAISNEGYELKFLGKNCVYFTFQHDFSNWLRRIVYSKYSAVFQDNQATKWNIFPIGRHKSWNIFPIIAMARNKIGGGEIVNRSMAKLSLLP